MLIDIKKISYEEEQLALMSAGLRCCDVADCDKPAEAVETDSDGATIYMCADHRD